MRSLFKLEMHRALHCWTFWACLGVSVVLAVIGAAEGIWKYFERHGATDAYLETSFINQYALNAFTQWLPNAVMSATPNLFFFAMPLLIGLAYGWSWRSDISDGYAVSVLVRAGRKEWERAKACAAFISGGLLITVPMLVNLAIVFCVLPAETPIVVDAMWNGVWGNAFLSEMFYSRPVAYMIVRFVLDFVLAGLWATAVLALSRCMRNKVVIVVLPYIVMLLFKYVSSSLGELVFNITGISWGALAIVDLLRVRADFGEYTWAGVMFCAVVLLVISWLIPAATRKRDVL